MQSIGRNGTKDISFTVEKDKMDATIELMQSYVETIGASSVVFDDDVAKVSIVGAGMESTRALLPICSRRCLRRT